MLTAVLSVGNYEAHICLNISYCSTFFYPLTEYELHGLETLIFQYATIYYFFMPTFPFFLDSSFFLHFIHLFVFFLFPSSYTCKIIAGHRLGRRHSALVFYLPIFNHKTTALEKPSIPWSKDVLSHWLSFWPSGLLSYLLSNIILPLFSSHSPLPLKSLPPSAPSYYFIPTSKWDWSIFTWDFLFVKLPWVVSCIFWLISTSPWIHTIHIL